MRGKKKEMEMEIRHITMDNIKRKDGKREKNYCEKCGKIVEAEKFQVCTVCGETVCQDCWQTWEEEQMCYYCVLQKK